MEQEIETNRERPADWDLASMATACHEAQHRGRWEGTRRPYSAEEVLELRGRVRVEHTLARLGAERLWTLLNERSYVHALGALTGNQAVQMVQAGLEAIYVSGWQVAADNNPGGQMYPDLNLYSCDSLPTAVKRLNNALLRADQIDHAQGRGRGGASYLAPLIADADAGFGGVLNTYELVRSMIEAGAAGVHLEDQSPSAKRCGHLGGKVLVPTQEFIQKLVAARLAADVADVPTVLIARTDANAAQLMTSDCDERDRPFMTGRRSPEGFFGLRGGIDQAIARGVAYAPYADLIWCETAAPDLDEARRFAEGVHKAAPGKMLAYNCSPSFNWRRKLDDGAIARFQRELGAMGYKFQFVTLAGFHTLNYAMWELAQGYHQRDMAAYVELQQNEFAAEARGYRAAAHQQFVGAGYYDRLSMVITGGATATQALAHSTEAEQFGGASHR